MWFLNLVVAVAMGARMTFYESLPRCCVGTQNYDPNADDTECEVYNACDWYGQFAYLSGTHDLDYVQANNIVSLFSSNAGDAGSYAGKYITITKSGYPPFTALVADTCGDSDCNGCCSANVGSDGWLVDVEYWTAVRHLGAANHDCPACSGTVTFTLASGPSAPINKPNQRPTPKSKKPTTKPPTPKSKQPNSNTCPPSQAGLGSGSGQPGSICVSQWDCTDNCVNAQCTATTGYVPSCALACPSPAASGSGTGIPGARCANQADCMDDCISFGGTKRCTSEEGDVPSCR